MGTFDQSGIDVSDYGKSAVGTFRIDGEADENKKPMFNLARIDCEKQYDDPGKANLECKVTSAIVWAEPENADPNKPNCSLDLDVSEYSMKELQQGIFTGMERLSSVGCFNTTLTIDRNVKRVYLSFTRTQYADEMEKTMPKICGMPPRTQVLMNCTGWPRIRKQGQTPPRYCDFSSSRDKVGGK